MILKSTIRKRWERGRWNFLVNAALRATPGTAVVVEGLDDKTAHSAAECIRRRTGANLVAVHWHGLLIAYKPSEQYWERVDEPPAETAAKARVA